MAVPIKAGIEKVPGGLMLVPMLVGAVVHTAAPDSGEFFGSFTGALYTGLPAILAVFYVCLGSTLDVKATPGRGRHRGRRPARLRAGAGRQRLGLQHDSRPDRRRRRTRLGRTGRARPAAQRAGPLPAGRPGEARGSLARHRTERRRAHHPRNTGPRYAATGPLDVSYVGELLGALAGNMAVKGVTRDIAVLGGDTSSHALLAMGVSELRVSSQFVTAAPVCRTDDNAAAADCRLLLKGGQVGPVDVLERFAHPTRPA